MGGWWNDTRIAVRGLLRRPALTLGALLTLGLGIGVNVGLTTVLYEVMLRPLPFAEPDRLVAVGTLAQNGRRLGVTSAELDILSRDAETFDGVAGVVLPGMSGRTILTVDGAPEAVEAVNVTPNLFRVLGVEPALGSGLGATRPWEEVEPAVFLSDMAWRNRFGADPSVVDRSLTVNGGARRVAGVLPPDVAIHLGPEAPEIYFVMAAGETYPEDDESLVVQAVARLRPGVTLDDVSAELARLEPVLHADEDPGDPAVETTVDPLRDRLIGDLSGPLVALGWSAGLVLLVACANLGTLFLARHAERSGDRALRAALGAGWPRLIRIPLLEALVLGLGGGVVGLGLAANLTDFVVGRVPGALYAWGGFEVGPGVLAATLGLSIVAGLLFGVVPAWLAAGARPGQTLRRESGRGTGSAVRATRVLAGVEAALLVVLLAATGLALRSLDALVSSDMGFATERRATATLIFPAGRYPDRESFGEFLLRVEEEARAVPGVEAAGTITHLPLDPASWGGTLLVEGEPVPETPVSTEWELASPGYFEAAGIPLVRGRAFRRSDDASSPMVTVVSRSLAEEIAPGGQVLGTRISATGEQGPWMTVVGVVEDVQQRQIAVRPRPFVYVAHGQMFPFPERELVVRATGEPLVALQEATERIRELEPLTVVARPRPVEALVDVALGRPRLVTLLLGLFGGASLLLALTGIVGVTAFAAARRRRELGIRACLGAERGELLRRSLGESMIPVAVGAAAGIASVLVLAPLAESLVHGVAPRDPLTLIGVAALLAGTASVAAFGPALRASRVDPGRVLREG